MAVNSVNGNHLLEKIGNCHSRNSKSKGNAYENFMGNLKEKAQEKEAQQAIQQSTAESINALQLDYRSGKLASELLLQKSGRVEMHAYIETAVRHISYAESDKVKVCTVEGYTLKAQVDADEHMVYIEQKNEDGTCQAYEVNPLKISENTKNPIEQMALEAWDIAKDLHNDGMFTEMDETKPADASTEKAVTFSEMVDKFEEFVEKRMEEGPPKIQIGGSEFTEDEWERLLKRIDKDIDAYKEELRERVRRQQEKEALKKRQSGAIEEEEEIIPLPV
ncbi:MAG: hypothetical protein J6A92_02125 [Lachnospiraceae bacterium]|nr:hypothetical protein [Lachnospiraceae bacterium]